MLGTNIGKTQKECRFLRYKQTQTHTHADEQNQTANSKQTQLR
eukprot:COSAG06_NODE_1830_length_8270_cov_19.516950_2_plen_43_part_00